MKVHEINKVTDFSNTFLKANYRASCYFILQWASRVLLQQDREIKSKLSAEYSDCICFYLDFCIYLGFTVNVILLWQEWSDVSQIYSYSTTAAG